MSDRSAPPMSAMKLALLAADARAQLDMVLRSEPIAVVGMSCRFPGNANSPEEFWRLLRAGKDAVTEIPPTRWDVNQTYDADPAAPGKTTVRHAGLLADIDGFDARFFGILPREAERMDPQQRIFMEVAIDALDRVGLPRERLAGSRTGVYVASYHNDYTQLQYADPTWIDSRTLTGTLQSFVANRLSYHLDLRGPSVTLDSACSSSLVAIHLACLGLRCGETDLALAGGVSVLAAPQLMIALSKVGFTSVAGRCRTFDAGADGFVRGEGCGVVVLKRLSDAVTAGDRVLSVIRSSVVNQDGHTAVMTAPNGLAQQALVREALDIARISPARVGFVETHGTGTPLGDPIEVEALASTVGAPRADGSACFLGSAKANVGHLEAAAGVVGLIKATLALQHAEIPPQIHFQKLNPHLSLAGTCLRVPTSPQPWSSDSPRVAGISSFGAGGTNAHVIVEEAPRLPSDPVPESAGPFILPLSAQSPTALTELGRRWLSVLGQNSAPLGVLCATAGERRSHYDYRLAIVGDTRRDMRAKLEAHLEGKEAAGVVQGGKVAGRARVAFVFAGQGSQWIGMGRELMARESVFRHALQDIDARISKLASWSLIAEIEAPPATARLSETEIAQPTILAIQLALCALWKSWGIVPDAVVGHSVGELAALHVAGVLSLDEAMRVVVQRARAMQRATGLGAMAAVALDASAAHALVQSYGTRLSVGALNSPRGVVLSGEREALSEVLARLDERAVAHRMLPVNYPFHSAQVAGLATEFRTAIGSVQTQAAEIPVYSTVTGAALASGSIDAEFLERNVRDPVRFAQAVEAMLEDGFAVFVEVGPHPVLSVSLAECAASCGKEIRLAASMRRERPERETLLQACATIYASGRAPSWELVNDATAEPLDLPAYPWEHTRYWLRDPPRSLPSARLAATEDAASHELLGGSLGLATMLTFARAWPDLAPQWLEDHRVGGRIVMPAAVMLDSLRAAAVRALRARAVRIVDFLVREPLVLGESPSVEWQISAQNTDHDRLALSLHARSAASEWRLIASAVGELGEEAPERASEDRRPIDGVAASPSPEALYASFSELGLAFGPSFRTVQRLAVHAGHAEVVLRRTNRSGAIDDEAVHATLLDGALQACVAAATGASRGIPRELLLPIGVDRYTAHASPVPEEVRALLRFDRKSADTIEASIKLHGPDGTLLAQVEGARFARASADSLGERAAADPWLHHIQWHTLAPSTATPAASAGDTWLVFVDDASGSERLCAELHSCGRSVIRVYAGTGFARLDAERYSIDPADPRSFEMLLAEVSAELSGTVLRIAHLWSLGIAPKDSWETKDVDLLTGGSALHLLQAVLKRPELDAHLVFFTRGAQAAGSAVPQPLAAGLWGFARAVGAEFPDLDLRIIDLDPDSPELPIDQMLTAARRSSAPRCLAFRGGSELAPRISRLPAVRRVAADARLESAGGGTLDALAWRDAAFPPPADDEVRVRVQAAGLNFRDVLLALGAYHGNGAVPLGAECAGVVEEVGSAVFDLKPDDRVFGFAPASLASRVNVPRRFLARVPDMLTMERAAALPAAYLTVIYGLDTLAGLRAGMRVLIHAATGGVGLAAVHWAKLVGAEIFATAGSPAKRDLLRSMGVTHVFDSRSLEFVDKIRDATRGEGVDVVLNSLAGDFIPASFAVLGSGGYFLELGKRDIWSPEEAARARPDARYRAYDLGAQALADHALAEALMNTLVSKLSCGELAPLPVRVFDFEQAGAAFRFMAQARHVGKLVLKAPATAQDEDGRRPLARADATYLITGGLGGLGVRTARWLVGMGARHLVLTGRHPPASDARRVIAECAAAGASIQVRAVDAGDETGMRSLLNEIADRMPPLRGIVHAAGMLDDGVVLQQNWSRWQRVLHGKARGARILHTLSMNLPLDFFVMYSAAGLLLGPRAQASYAAANAELDALAQSRRASGLTALSIAWGQWSEAGMAAATSAGGHDQWSARGLQWISPDEGFARLESLLRRDIAYAAVLPIDWQRFAATDIAAADRDFFDDVLQTTAGAGARRDASAAAPAPAAIVERWRAAPESQRRMRILESLKSQTLNVLGLPESQALDPAAPLKDAGLDSLMAVELRNVLSRLVARTLPATLLFDYPSLDALATHLMRVLGLQSAEAAAAAPDGTLALEIASLTDDEAEAALLAELSREDVRSAS